MSGSLGLNLRLVFEWLPAFHIFPAIAAAPPGHDRALEVLRLVEFISTKTDTPLDDELTKLVKGILLTPQGEALVDYITDKVRSLSNEPA